MQNNAQNGKNASFPTVNPHAEHFGQFENARLMQRLEKKYRPKPYWRAYGLLRNVVFGSSFLFHTLSAATAFVLVFTFLRGLIGNEVAAGLITISGLSALELSKREISGRFFGSIFQYRKFSPGLALAIVGLMAISTAASYFGAKRAVVELTPPPITTSADSLTAPLRAQVADLDQQIKQARATKWNGKTTAAAQRTIEKLSGAKALILAEITRQQQRTDGHNDSALAEHTSALKINAAGFGLFTATCEILLVLCLFYLEYFDYRSFVERCANPENEAQRQPTAPGIGYHFNGTSTAQPATSSNGLPHNETRRPIGFFQQGNGSVNNATVSEPAKSPFVKNCAHCEKEFLAKVMWQKFCSEGCKLDHHEAKHGQRFDPAYKKKSKAPA